MTDNPRIEELRRRVQKDPASIAFAQLAEEHRRAGNFEEAVAVATVGLQQHPAYLSARVTLGRALLELGRLDEAAVEFEHVVLAAPDNLTAARQLADIRQRQKSNDPASTPSSVPSSSVPLSSAPPQTPQVSAPTVAEPPRVKPEPAVPKIEPAAPAALKVEAVAPDPLAPRIDQIVSMTTQTVAPEDAIIDELEAWLAVLATERSAREGSSGSQSR